MVLVGSAGAPLVQRVVISVAAGMTFSVVWEVWEYYAFVTRSAEVGTAYADTVGDLALGWLGAVCVAVLLGSRGVFGASTTADATPVTVGTLD